MKTEDFEIQAKKLAKTVKKLEQRLTIQEDIQAINKLMNAYGYYLEHWQEDQITSLWSHRDDVSLEIHDTGLYTGYKAVKQSFQFKDHYTGFNGEKVAPPEYLHILIPSCGIIDVDPKSKTAKGRWYGQFLGALPRGGKLRALIGCGIWENEFVKEDGIWKFFKLTFNDIISSPLDEGWVKTPYLANPPAHDRPASSPNFHAQTYPSGYIFPYHYKNPVTGK